MAASKKKNSNLRADIIHNLFYRLGRTEEMATLNDWYLAVSYTIRDRMMKNWTSLLKQFYTHEIKFVGYLSAEFLMGPHLGNAVVCLGLEEDLQEAIDELGLDLQKILHHEEEPGLGNGGLGRLAACYLDSMATLHIPAVGYGIRYQYGIFDQKIVDGKQVEVTDNWLRHGNPWELEQHSLHYRVKFGGSTTAAYDEDGVYRVVWKPEFEVKGVAYDTPVPGYKNSFIALLRLWKSEAVESFDFSQFNVGNYHGAVNDKTIAETLTKVLYPNDEQESGKRLRLMQQYFFVSCSLQDAIRVHLHKGLPLQKLSSNVALQLNDTHPSVAIAEMMRLLVDEYHIAWSKAWEITTEIFGYTNHTLLPEALEKWPLPIFASLLPRHLEIIYEINNQFLDQVKENHPGDEQLVKNLSLIDETGSKFVRMANLAAVGSHHINGVAALHTELLKKDVLQDFNRVSKHKFLNVTNGVTPRRWMRLYNPGLSRLITEKLGEAWVSNLQDELPKLEAFVNDKEFQKRWYEVKLQNKRMLADKLFALCGVTVSPESMFDIQVKRFHEYKRQHLSLLHIITLYNRIKRNPAIDIVPRTFVFGGKAAPGYYMAKSIIHLINAVAEIINDDADVAGRIKVVFFPDYNVKNSEWVYRAADLSEQISLAGKEASGTGNMKFSLNGALTIGTLDGANVEIMNAVGVENFFLFGLKVNEVADLRMQGYSPTNYIHANPELQEVIGMISSGFFANGDRSVFQTIVDELTGRDQYLLAADYASYMACQQQVSDAFRNRDEWVRKSILNVSRMGYFSSDRAVAEYCQKVWKVNPYLEKTNS